MEIFDLFCSCDLDLDPMTFIYELYPYSLEIYRCANMNFVGQDFRKLSSNRQTDGHTEINTGTTPPGGWSTLALIVYMYMQIVTSVRRPRPRPQLNVSLCPCPRPRTLKNLADATRLHPHNVSFIIGMHRFKRLII